MRQYFQFVERNNYLQDVPGTDDEAKKKGHGLAGWLQTERYNPQNLADKGDFRLLALLKGALLAFREAGISAATETAAKFRAHKTDNAKLRQIGNDLVKEMSPILNRDVNALVPGRDGLEGVFRVPLATNTGARNGTRNLLVATAKQTDKLKIQLETFVTRLVFDDEKDADGKLVARGVEYIKGAHLYRASRKPQAIPQGQRTIVKARYEVIVSCGAFNTPQLLMLSGIGPKSQIGEVGETIGSRQGGTLQGDANSKGQKVLMNLEGVGKNLQDRYEACVVTSTGLPFELINDCKFTGAADDPCMTQWEQKPTKGPYSTDGSLVCFTKKSSVAENGNIDLAVIGYAGLFAGYKRGQADDFVILKDQKGEVIKDKDGNPAVDLGRWTWQLIKVHNRNRAGSVELRSTNPWDTPIINFRHFDDNRMTDAAQKDLKGVVEGLKFLRQVQAAGAPMLNEFHPIDEVLPGTKPARADEPLVYGRGSFNSDEELGQFVKDNTWGHHASCTCPMLPPDQGGVVNGQFQVHGVSRLRIVDASIFPKTPGVFIVTPIYMMSEKATDDILESIGAARRVS
jgi:choline dehydrogenase